MEISRTHIIPAWLVRLLCSMLLFILPTISPAQEPVTKYSVKNGRMYIELSKDISLNTLENFILQFQLKELHLKEFILRNMEDSLRKQGWKVERNNDNLCIISKPLHPADKMDNAVERMIMAAPSFAERFPVTSTRLPYGFNRFRNKQSFGSPKDSIVRFFLRNNKNARRVTLAGSFNDWDPNKLAMIKTDSGWIFPLKLGPGKYWYKFIVDGNWIVDEDNLLKENDGFGNINSIFYKPNTVFTLTGHMDAKKVILSGSFNNWTNKDVHMQRTTEGWQLPVYLANGTHTYKYIVDGHWIMDPRNNNKLPDGTGGYNSYYSIGKPRLFKLNGYTNAQNVKLVGSFNNWRDFELSMNKTSTGWELPYVLGPGNYEYKFVVDNKWISDPRNPGVNIDDNSTIVIDPNYTFRLKGYNNATHVFLAGDFNSWNPNSFLMKKQDGEWVLPLHLGLGKHRYKFIVDGKWILDPANKLWEENDEGTGNSILWIGR